MLPESEQHRQLLGDFLLRVDALGFSPNTRRLYRLAVTHFLEARPLMPLASVGSDVIERHIYGRPIGARSKVVELMALRRFFRFLVSVGVRPDNPAAKVEKPRWRETPRAAVSFEEFERLSMRCRTLEEAAIVELFYYTGLRLRELITLKIGQIDFSLRRIHLVGKGGKARTVIFPERVAHLLRVHLEPRTDPDAWVFPSQHSSHSGMPRSDTWTGDLIRRLGREATLPYRVTPHVLRHGFVRLLKVRNVPLDVAAKLCGHNSIMTTSKLYGRLDVGDLQKIYDAQIVG